MNNRSARLKSLSSAEICESVDLLIAAGGFEDRALAFVKAMRQRRIVIKRAIILHYPSDLLENERNYELLLPEIATACSGTPIPVDVDPTRPIVSYERIKTAVRITDAVTTRPRAVIDISSMTHMWAIGAMHACIEAGYDVSIAYSEADQYFPLRRQARELKRAWLARDYKKAEKLLQSAALMAVHILPDFAGNLRPAHPSCLILFAGYEPNRLEGLVESYAPGALVVLYGKSPRAKHNWRSVLSKQLHESMFANWPRREEECSTIDPDKATEKLEQIFSVISHKYDIAIAPHCSKMQAVGAYVFWRQHPETQLIFTSPVRFRPAQYSSGVKELYVYELSNALRVAGSLPSMY
jgi:hypothetical protein